MMDAITKYIKQMCQLRSATLFSYFLLSYSFLKQKKKNHINYNNKKKNDEVLKRKAEINNKKKFLMHIHILYLEKRKIKNN